MPKPKNRNVANEWGTWLDTKQIVPVGAHLAIQANLEVENVVVGEPETLIASLVRVSAALTKGRGAIPNAERLWGSGENNTS